VLGKHSGRHAFVDALEKLGITLEDGQLNRAFAGSRTWRDRKMHAHRSGPRAIVRRSSAAGKEDLLVLEAVQVGGGRTCRPRRPSGSDGRGADRGVRDRRRHDRRGMGAIGRAPASRLGSSSFHVSGVTGGPTR
jgi:2-isopropylmalate synthase